MPVSPKQKGAAEYGERERKRKAGIDRDRGSSTQRGYGYKWQQYRVGYLARHPLCERCEAKGKLVPATVINHRRDHGGDQLLFWDEANHEPLCKACHDEHTARTVLNAKL